MGTNRAKLSPNALRIFKKTKKYYPPDPWGNPRWIVDGRVYINGWLDLCKSEDRKSLMEAKKSLLGHVVELEASSYRNKNGSLKGFNRQCFPRIIQDVAELLLLLNDLDFQIETMDIVEV